MSCTMYGNLVYFHSLVQNGHCVKIMLFLLYVDGIIRVGGPGTVEQKKLISFG